MRLKRMNFRRYSSVKVRHFLISCIGYGLLTWGGIACTPQPENGETSDAPLVEETTHADEGQVISLFQGTKPGGILLDSIVEKVEYLYLEEDIFLPGVLEIRVWDKHILVVTQKHERAYLFTREGRGLFRIGKKGRGPGEHFNIGAIQINPFDRTIDLISLYPSRIMQYDLEGGKLLREIPLFEGIDYAYFYPLDSDRYLFSYHKYYQAYPDNNHHFLVYNAKKQEMDKRYVPFREDEMGDLLGIYGAKVVFSSDDTAVYASYFNDIHIYGFTADQMQRAYTLEFGPPFASDLTISGKFDFKRVYKEKSICCIDPFVVTDHYVFGSYIYENYLGNSFVYSRKSGKLIEYRDEELVNTFNGIGLFSYNIVGISGNQLIVSALPSELSEAVEANQQKLIPEEAQKVKQVLDQVNLSSGNPILMFYTFKEF